MFIQDVLQNTFKLVYGPDRAVLTVGNDVHLLNADIANVSPIDDRRYAIILQAVEHFNRYFQTDISILFTSYTDETSTFSFQFPRNGWSPLDMIELINFVLSLVLQAQQANDPQLEQARQRVTTLTQVGIELTELWTFLLNTSLDNR